MIYKKDGKILVPADGKLCSSCCVTGDDCEHCAAGETPSQIQVVISGVADCPCLESFVPNQFFEAEGAAADINGIHVLTQTGSPCIWSTTVHFVYKLYNGIVDCSLNIYDRDYERALIVTKIDANNAEVFCEHIFEGSGVIISDCVNTSFISNDLDQGNCWEEFDCPAMYGGTAVITEIW